MITNIIHGLTTLVVPQQKSSLLKTLAFYGAVTVIERLIGSAGGKEKQIYQELKQPPWAPPAWVFAPAWILNNMILLYGNKRLMESPDTLPHKKALMGLQGLIWGVYATFNYVYFKKKSPVLAAVWTQADMIFALTSLILASRGDKKIAMSFVPLTLWTTFASTLAWYQALYNPDDLLKTEAPLELPA